MIIKAPKFKMNEEVDVYDWLWNQDAYPVIVKASIRNVHFDYHHKVWVYQVSGHGSWYNESRLKRS